MSIAALGDELAKLLRLAAPPIGITFSDVDPGLPRYDAPMPEATPDGRTGRVPAGCVFWMKGAERTFTTVPEDHGNCSVGSLTHGLIELSEAATRADVAALVESGWVTPDIFPQIPTMSKRSSFITYGPLQDAPADPDLVFIRVDGKQLMTLRDALPGLRIEGKPQCHIVPIAAEQNEVAASVGCALSRVRRDEAGRDDVCHTGVASRGGRREAARNGGGGLDGRDLRGGRQAPIHVTDVWIRPAARVVILDPDDHVLLQLIRSPGGGEWWITPGGALEDGESIEEAALRELYEELGMRDAVLGPAIWTRRHVFSWDGRTYDQRETFLLCRVPQRFEPVPTISAEQLAKEGVVTHRWWSVEEIEAASVEFAPRNVATLLRGLLAGGVPAEPLDAGI